MWTVREKAFEGAGEWSSGCFSRACGIQADVLSLPPNPLIHLKYLGLLHVLFLGLGGRVSCAGRKHAGYPGKGITRQLPRELVPVAMEMGQFVKYLLESLKTRVQFPEPM